MPRKTSGPSLFAVLVAFGSMALGCATYEASPVHDRGEESGGGSPSPATQPSTGGHAGSTSAFGGSAGRPSGAAGATASMGGAPGTSGSGAGGAELPDSGGTAGSGGNGASGAAGAPSGLAQTWTFDGGGEGWEVREQSAELSAVLTPAPGALQLVDVPFSAPKQYVDVAYAFDAATDLRGRTLRATVQRSSGGFVGAQLYVYGGAWVSPGFESLSSGDVTVVSLALDSVTSGGFTPESVSRIGIKLSTGSNATNTFAATTIELTEVALE